MNILLLCTHLNPGGLSRYVINLSKGLVSQGDNVYVVASGGEWQEELESTGVVYLEASINTKSIVSVKILRSFFKILPLIKKYNIEVLHANTRVTQVLASMLSSSCKIPYISTFHGFYKAHFMRRLFVFEGKYSIAVSGAVKEHISNDFKIKKRNILVVHSGVPIDDFYGINITNSLRGKD